MIEVLLPFLPVIFGGISATVAVANFALTHSRKLNSWQSLRDGLQKFSKTRTRKRHENDEENLIINWLSYGDLIITPLRSRLINRLWMTLAVIITLAVGSSFSTSLFSDNTALLIDSVVGFAQINRVRLFYDNRE